MQVKLAESELWGIANSHGEQIVPREIKGDECDCEDEDEECDCICICEKDKKCICDESFFNCDCFFCSIFYYEGKSLIDEYEGVSFEGYEQISTFVGGRAIVRHENQVFVVNGRNQRIDLLKNKESEGDFKVGSVGNYDGRIVPVSINGKWVRVSPSGEFVEDQTAIGYGSTGFEELGMYNDGYAAVKKDGKWGVIGTSGGSESSDFLIEPKYDEIICDELGRCFSQNAFFVREGDKVYLYIKKDDSVKRAETHYQDARPFEDGWAAVKKNDKWSFIDSDGNDIEFPEGSPFKKYSIEDALSFSGHLAAVKVDGLWGYLSLMGELVIEPEFIEAKSFFNGRAVVYFAEINEFDDEEAVPFWGIISLKEFEYQ